MNQLKNKILCVFIFSLAAIPGYSQTVAELSDQLSASTSPVILRHCGIMVEPNYVYFKSFHVKSNHNFGLNLRYGILNLFELNAAYENNILKFNTDIDRFNDVYKFGNATKIGIKLLAYTSKNKKFIVAIAGNYYFKKPVLAYGKLFDKPGPVSYEPDPIDYMKISKIAEVTFRNILSEKFILNYSASYNNSKGPGWEIAAGVAYKITKHFYAGLDAYTTFDDVNYYEGYYYLRPTISYLISPCLQIQLTTSGEIDNYYGYSQQGMLGISWKIK